MAKKISQYTPKTLAFIDTDLFEVSKDISGTPTTQNFTWAELKAELGLNYDSAVLQLAQTNLLTPTLRTLNNTFTAAWSTTYSGVGDYMLVQNGAFADLTKVWIAGMSIDISAGFIALPIISSGSFSGYMEIHVYNSDKLIMKVYDSAANPSNLSDLIGDGKYISLPEIRVYF
jgi:hypothetical protein